MSKYIVIETHTKEIEVDINENEGLQVLEDKINNGEVSLIGGKIIDCRRDVVLIDKEATVLADFASKNFKTININKLKKEENNLPFEDDYVKGYMAGKNVLIEKILKDEFK